MTTTELYEDKLGQINEQLERVAAVPFHRERLEAAGVDPASVNSIEEFRQIPYMETSDLLETFEEEGPLGSLYTSDVRQVNMTPAGAGLMPEYNTEYDLDQMAEHFAEQFRAQGVRPGDVAVNCMGYTIFIAGLAIHRGLQKAGAAVVPVGAGDSEQAARTIKRLDADVLAAFPSFGLKIAEEADADIDLFVGGGEPFTSVPGLRNEVRTAFGGDATVVDVFALSEILPVAAECSNEQGLHIADDYVLAEVIDPETLEPVEPGERGEIVLTHLQKEAMPLVRYRTGDLTTLVTEECKCGQSLTLPNGVYGRVDSRLKVKGVKFYPDSIGPILTEFPSLTSEYQIEIMRSSDTDTVTITCQTPKSDSVDIKELREALATELLITPDEVHLTEDLDTESQVVDHRY
jgi:phenylacetate-CoA ligase